MKKGYPSKLRVKRVNVSPYFSSSFVEQETKKINAFENVEYLASNSPEIANILITNTQTQISQLDKEEIKNCELMIHPNSGYDNFDTNFVTVAHFPIIIGNPIRSHAVTNYIMSGILSHYSPIPFENEWSKKRFWPRKTLNQLNVLILGEGHIGSLLKQSLTPLVASLNIYDPFLGKNVFNLENCDVLILACSLNYSNHHIINKDVLLKLNHDFLLINAARGGLVNLLDLIDVLKMKPQAYAILDVFEKEPFDFSIFKEVQNITATSHIAGVYSNIDDVTIKFETQVIHDFINLSKEDFKIQYSKMILNNRVTKEGYLI